MRNNSASSLDRKPDVTETDAAERYSVLLPDESFLLEGTFTQVGFDLVVTNINGHSFVVEDYFSFDPPPNLMILSGAGLSSDMVMAKLHLPYLDMNFAGPAGDANALEFVGQVNIALGRVFVKRVDAGGEIEEVELARGDKVYQGDELETGANSFVKLTMLDGTSFTLGKDANAILTNYLFDESARSGTFEAFVNRGGFNYKSGKIAGLYGLDVDHSKISTPTAIIGIRGSELDGNVDAQGNTTIVHRSGILSITDINGQNEVILDTPGNTSVVTFSGVGRFEIPTQEQITTLNESLPPPALVEESNEEVEESEKDEGEDAEESETEGEDVIEDSEVEEDSDSEEVSEEGEDLVEESETDESEQAEGSELDAEDVSEESEVAEEEAERDADSDPEEASENGDDTAEKPESDNSEEGEASEKVSDELADESEAAEEAAEPDAGSDSEEVQDEGEEASRESEADNKAEPKKPDVNKAEESEEGREVGKEEDSQEAESDGVATEPEKQEGEPSPDSESPPDDGPPADGEAPDGEPPPDNQPSTDGESPPNGEPPRDNQPTGAGEASPDNQPPLGSEPPHEGAPGLDNQGLSETSAPPDESQVSGETNPEESLSDQQTSVNEDSVPNGAFSSSEERASGESPTLGSGQDSSEGTSPQAGPDGNSPSSLDSGFESGPSERGSGSHSGDLIDLGGGSDDGSRDSVTNPVNASDGIGTGPSVSDGGADDGGTSVGDDNQSSADPPVTELPPVPSDVVSDSGPPDGAPPPEGEPPLDGEPSNDEVPPDGAPPPEGEPPDEEDSGDRPPVANDDLVQTVAGGPQTFTSVDVAQEILANDFDPDEGDVPELQSIGPVGSLGGTITLNADGGGVYQPNAGVLADLAPGETVTESFSYTIISNGKTASATITIELTAPEEDSPPNVPPGDSEPPPDNQPPADGEPPPEGLAGPEEVRYGVDAYNLGMPRLPNIMSVSNLTLLPVHSAASALESILITDEIELDFSGVNSHSDLEAVSYVGPNDADSRSNATKIGQIVERSSQGISGTVDSLFTEKEVVFIQQSPIHEKFKTSGVIDVEESSFSEEPNAYVENVHSASRAGERPDGQVLSEHEEPCSESLSSALEKPLKQDQPVLDSSSVLRADGFPELEELIVSGETSIDLSNLELADKKNFPDQDQSQINLSELVDNGERNVLEGMLNEAFAQTHTHAIPKEPNISDNFNEPTMFHRAPETLTLGVLEFHENPLDWL